MTTQDTGLIGESIAEGFLLGRGFTIQATNYRYGRAEIDLIAKKDDTLYFVEVKTRRGFDHGHPSAGLTDRQEKLLAKAAANYMYEVGHEWAFRFDVIAIVLYKDGNYDLEHLEDVFFPGLF